MEHLSGYEEWEDASHADQWLVYPENFGPKMSIDETSLSDGELYTVVTNKDKHTRSERRFGCNHCGDKG